MSTASDTVSVSDQVRAAFDFEVNKLPLFGPENIPTSNYGLFRSDRTDITSCIGRTVKAKYVPHTTDDVVAIVEAAQTAFDDDIDVSCHFNEGHYVNISPSDATRRSVFGTKDNVFPRMIVHAGFDGQSFKATLGFYRDACLNLSMMRKLSCTTVSIRHTSRLRDEMDDLIRQLSGLENTWESITEVIDHMENRTVRLHDFLAAVYPAPLEDESGRTKTIHTNRIKAIFKRLEDERRLTGRGTMPADYAITGWEAYNAVQSWEQHVKPAKVGSTDFDRIIRASRRGKDDKIGLAEELALTM